MREHKNKISQLLSLGVRSDETFTPKLQTPVEKSVFLQRQKPSKTVGYSITILASLNEKNWK